MLLFSFAACVLAGCSDARVNGLSFPATDEGPFGAGYRTLTVGYTSFDGLPREIDLALWYPTRDVSVDEGGPEDSEFPRYAGLFADPTTIVGATLAPAAFVGGYPVIVHSHGHYGFAENSYRLATALARHGFVVVAPSHPGDTIADLASPTALRNFVDRPLDVSAALDALEALPADDPLAGALVLDRVVVTGHSRGTFTVFALLGATLDAARIDAMCAEGSFDEAGGCAAAELARLARGFLDPRVVGGVAMAGTGDRAFYGPTGQNTITRPLLLMTGSEDDVGAAGLVSALVDAEVAWVDVAGGCHQLYGFGGCPSIDDAVGQPIVRTYALAFARRQLFMDADPVVVGVLDGSYVVSDLASFTP